VSNRFWWWFGGGIVAVIAIDRVTRLGLSALVTAAILDKMGPNPPESARKAAQAAGRCFAEDLSVADLVEIGLNRATSGN